MVEEIFGPVLTIYLYKPKDWKSIISLVDKTSPYGLTGSVIGQDKIALEEAKKGLVHSAGNFYINDKPTGAVVGQQPFGAHAHLVQMIRQVRYLTFNVGFQ